MRVANRISLRPRQARPGYTLLELVLVLVLLVIVASLVYPSIDAMNGSGRMTQAADMIRAAWAAARSHAIDEGQPYRFAIVPNMGNLRVAPDQPSYWSGTGRPSTPADPTNPPQVLSEALPKGLRFQTANATPSAGLTPGDSSSLPPETVPLESWSARALFLPDGTAREDVVIILAEKGGRQMTLYLRALTGAVTVRWSKAEVKAK
jgi:prepilin-type N-terminal cleavage/methylation domain-containing protein